MRMRFLIVRTGHGDIKNRQCGCGWLVGSGGGVRSDDGTSKKRGVCFAPKIVGSVLEVRFVETDLSNPSALVNGDRRLQKTGCFNAKGPNPTSPNILHIHVIKYAESASRTPIWSFLYRFHRTETQRQRIVRIVDTPSQKFRWLQDSEAAVCSISDGVGVCSILTLGELCQREYLRLGAPPFFDLSRIA